jgi:flavin reductase (DIM6/NTAB) family NADH-FMN oxidoreductase RutF
VRQTIEGLKDGLTVQYPRYRLGRMREKRRDGRRAAPTAGGRKDFDLRQFRHALGRFATGITVITTRTAGGKCEGLTANSFGAVSLDPPLVLWSLRQDAMSLPSFRESRHFAVNVLASHQRGLSNHFARPAPDKFEEVDWKPGLAGCPTLPDCLALFECSAERTVEAGDHVVFIGRVQQFRWRAGEPLVFSCGHYCLTAVLPEDPRADIAPSDFADLML